MNGKGGAMIYFITFNNDLFDGTVAPCQRLRIENKYHQKEDVTLKPHFLDGLSIKNVAHN